MEQMAAEYAYKPSQRTVVALPVAPRTITNKCRWTSPLVHMVDAGKVRTDLAASKMAFMMPLSLSSTSSLLQAMRALFCAISKPDTATPPALAAFAGPNSILFLWYTAMACAHGQQQ